MGFFATAKIALGEGGLRETGPGRELSRGSREVGVKLRALQSSSKSQIGGAGAKTEARVKKTINLNAGMRDRWSPVPRSITVCPGRERRAGLEAPHGDPEGAAAGDWQGIHPSKVTYTFHIFSSLGKHGDGL